MVEEIERLYRKTKDLSYVGAFAARPALVSAGTYYFYSWRNAVTAAGFDYLKMRRQEEWSKDRIVKLLRLARQRKDDFSHNEFERNHFRLFHAAVNHFGSWGEALRQVGVDYRKVRKFNEWDRRIIVREIKRLRKKGVDLSLRAMHEKGNGAVVSASQHHFGSWRNAIQAAGLDYQTICKREKWSPDRILRIIRQLHRQGQDVSWSARMKAGQLKMVVMGAHYFGSWGAAVSKAGVDYEKVRKHRRWSSQLVVSEIKRLKRQGLNLSYRGLVEAGYHSLVYAGGFYFPNWGAAIKSAGLDYDKIKGTSVVKRRKRQGKTVKN